MFNMDRCNNRPIVAPIVLPTEAPIQIKHVHSSVSYQWATYQIYDRRGCESPSARVWGFILSYSDSDMGPKKIRTWDMAIYEIRQGTRVFLRDRDMRHCDILKLTHNIRTPNPNQIFQCLESSDISIVVLLLNLFVNRININYNGAHVQLSGA